VPITSEGRQLIYDALARLLGGWVTVTCETVPERDVVWAESMYATVESDTWTLPPFVARPVVSPDLAEPLLVTVRVYTDALVPFLELGREFRVGTGVTLDVPSWTVDLGFGGTVNITDFGEG
jgi:hypothetical protein